MAAVDSALSGALLQVLQQNFGFTAFRPQQVEAVAATLSGRDVLLILPTGEHLLLKRLG